MIPDTTPPEDFADSCRTLRDEYGYEVLVNPDNPSEIASLYPRLTTQEVAERCGLEGKYKRAQRWTPQRMQAFIDGLIDE
jgi:hypothetical protein